MRQFPWGQSINGIKMIEERKKLAENFSLQTNHATVFVSVGKESLNLLLD